MSDRYRRYGLEVAIAILLKVDACLSREELKALVDSIPAPAPTQAESYDAPTGEIDPDAVRRLLEMNLPIENSPEAQKLNSWDVGNDEMSLMLRVCQDYLRLRQLSPPGTTTPDVQAQCEHGQPVCQPCQHQRGLQDVEYVDAARKRETALAADVQAQVDAAQRPDPWWTADDAAKARAQWQVGESEENWRARVLDAAVAAEREACLKIVEEAAFAHTVTWMIDKIRARSAQER